MTCRCSRSPLGWPNCWSAWLRCSPRSGAIASGTLSESGRHEAFLARADGRVHALVDQRGGWERTTTTGERGVEGSVEGGGAISADVGGTEVGVTAQQVAERGIRVNVVAPGPVWTPLQVSGGQPKEALEEFGAQAPLGRPGQPAEMAPAYVFLASQESSYVSGETLNANGGTPTP